MIRTVIFDIDGTMYDYEGRNRIAMEAVENYCLLHMNVDRAAFCQALQAANEVMAKRMDRSCASIHNRLIRFQCMLEILELPLFPHAQGIYHTYWNTLISGMEPYPGLLEWMGLLRDRGIYIGVGTNMTAYIQYRKLEQLKAAGLIDWIVTSEEAGKEKPDGRFFRLCVEKSRMRPEECLFVGDSLEGDVMGALSGGMRALLFEPVPKERDGTDKRYRVIRSYRECLEDGWQMRHLDCC